MNYLLFFLGKFQASNLLPDKADEKVKYKLVYFEKGDPRRHAHFIELSWADKSKRFLKLRRLDDESTLHPITEMCEVKENTAIKFFKALLNIAPTYKEVKTIISPTRLEDKVEWVIDLKTGLSASSHYAYAHEKEKTIVKPFPPDKILYEVQRFEFKEEPDFSFMDLPACYKQITNKSKGTRNKIKGDQYHLA